MLKRYNATGDRADLIDRRELLAGLSMEKCDGMAAWDLMERILDAPRIYPELPADHGGDIAAAVAAMDYVREHLDISELLTQLAEECSELSKAALKLRRAETGMNPTPKTPPECWSDFWEEIDDVDLVLRVLDVSNCGKITSMMCGKAVRWMNRIKGADDKQEGTDSEDRT